MKQKLLNLLDQHKIYYTEKGPNVKKGGICIKCPWCGPDDPSEHMGINLESQTYGCWRNASHRGRDLPRLIQVLIGCTLTEARLLIDADRVTIQGQDFYSQVVETLTISDRGQEIERMGGVSELELPKQFGLVNDWGIKIRFWAYLRDRGFTGSKEKLQYFIDRMGICCCLSGDYKFRLIFPIYYKNQLVTWTSRSIYPDAYLRYKDLEIEKSVRHVKFCLYGFDDLLEKGGKKLFVCEGPLDFLKLEYFFPNDSYRATCIFTISVQPEQTYLLSQLSKEFDEVILLLDRGAETQMLQLKMNFGFIKNLRFMYLPEGVKDPGEMNENQVFTIIKSY